MRPDGDFSGCFSSSTSCGILPSEVSLMISCCLFSSLDNSVSHSGSFRHSAKGCKTKCSPISHIIRLPHAHRPPRIKQGPDRIIIPRTQHQIFMNLRRSGLDTRYESCPDPHTRSTVGERGGQTTTVSDGTCCDDGDRLACQGGFVWFAEVNYGGDEDGEGHVAGVATAFP